MRPEWAETGLNEHKPESHSLAIYGTRKPEGVEFQARVEPLLGAAFAVMMSRTFGGKRDYAMCRLNGWFGIKRKAIFHSGQASQVRPTASFSISKLKPLD